MNREMHNMTVHFVAYGFYLSIMIKIHLMMVKWYLMIAPDLHKMLKTKIVSDKPIALKECVPMPKRIAVTKIKPRNSASKVLCSTTKPHRDMSYYTICLSHLKWWLLSWCIWYKNRRIPSARVDGGQSSQICPNYDFKSTDAIQDKRTYSVLHWSESFKPAETDATTEYDHGDEQCNSWEHEHGLNGICNRKDLPSHIFMKYIGEKRGHPGKSHPSRPVMVIDCYNCISHRVRCNIRYW